ncbi:hypothetical protein NFI96_016701 [Prochilodus magdalenae]|nr:hypothetical protein NFI96_016701 [Prochilodus magdalenae]
MMDIHKKGNMAKRRKKSCFFREKRLQVQSGTRGNGSYLQNCQQVLASDDKKIPISKTPEDVLKWYKMTLKAFQNGGEYE